MNLYEAEHRYYCADCNYFSNYCSFSYGSWSDFIAVAANEDHDLNLVFRWDWEENEIQEEDPYYRNGTLHLYYMGQRIGLFFIVQVDVCKADEPAIREFLQIKFDKIKSIWSPIV